MLVSDLKKKGTWLEGKRRTARESDVVGFSFDAEDRSGSKPSTSPSSFRDRVPD